MKKLLALTLALALCLGLAACGGGTSTDTDTNADTSSDADTNGDATANGKTITLTVGATPNPHAEILAQVKDDLAARGHRPGGEGVQRLRRAQHRRGGG